MMASTSDDRLAVGPQQTSAVRCVVDVRFVLGKAFHEAALGKRALRKAVGASSDSIGGSSTATPESFVSAERAALATDDFYFVEGREKLPNVGKVTEKSDVEKSGVAAVGYRPR